MPRCRLDDRLAITVGGADGNGTGLLSGPVVPSSGGLRLKFAEVIEWVLRAERRLVGVAPPIGLLS
jgi:hypothetical protein